jgi:hypothetical protein
LYSEAAQCAWNPYMYWVATYYLFSVNEFISRSQPQEASQAYACVERAAFTLQSVGDLTTHP